jgi:hypothetical protein
MSSNLFDLIDSVSSLDTTRNHIPSGDDKSYDILSQKIFLWYKYVKNVEPEKNTQIEAFEKWFFNKYYLKETFKQSTKYNYDFATLKHDKNVKQTVMAIKILEQSFKKPKLVMYETLSKYVTYFSVNYLQLLHKFYQGRDINNKPHFMFYFTDKNQIINITKRHVSYVQWIHKTKHEYAKARNFRMFVNMDETYMDTFLRYPTTKVINAQLDRLNLLPLIPKKNFIDYFSITYNSRLWFRWGFFNFYPVFELLSDTEDFLRRKMIKRMRPVLRLLKKYNRYFNHGYSWSDTLSSRYIFRNNLRTIIQDNYVNAYRVYKVNTFTKSNIEDKCTIMLYVGPRFKLLLGGLEYVINPKSEHLASVGFFEGRLQKTLYHSKTKHHFFNYRSRSTWAFNKTVKIYTFLPCYIYNNKNSRQINCHVFEFTVGGMPYNMYSHMMKHSWFTGTPILYCFFFLIELGEMFNLNATKLMYAVHYTCLFIYNILCNGASIYYNHSTLFLGNNSGSFIFVSKKTSLNTEIVYTTNSYERIRK